MEQGSYGDLRLDGLNIGLYANWPAAIHEGNGVATYLIDERADEPQRSALRVLLEGGGGGPWAIFRKTFTELHGPRYLHYEVNANTKLPLVVAAGAVTLEMEYTLNPVTKETIHPRLPLPKVLLSTESTLFGTTQFTVRDAHMNSVH